MKNKIITKLGDLILDELGYEGIECWIAGGAVRDYFMGEEVNSDYDLFFPSETHLMHTKEFLQANPDHEIIWESKNGLKIKSGGIVYDLVKKYFNGPSESLDAFDFTVSMFAVKGRKFYSGETSIYDLSMRKLVINKVTHPASTVRRAFSHYKRGFTMDASEMRKMIEAVHNAEKLDNACTYQNSGNASGDMQSLT